MIKINLILTELSKSNGESLLYKALPIALICLFEIKYVLSRLGLSGHQKG